MIDSITISSKIDSEFEFEMTAQGIKLQDATVLFQTEITPDITYDVRCKHVTSDRWSVKIPKSLIPNGSYNFKIAVIVEELIFEPVKGILRVVSEEIIEISGVDAKVKKPANKKPESTPEVTPELTPEVTEPKKVKENLLASLPKLQEQQSVAPKAKPPVVTANEAQLKTVQMKEGEGHEELIKRIIEERKRKAQVSETEQVTTPVPEPEVSVTPTLEVTETIEPEQPTSTPVVTATPTLDETVTPTTKKVVSENSIFVENARRKRANSAVKDIVSNMNNPQPTPEVTGTVEPGKFFDDLEELKKLNEKKAKNKAVRDAIEKSKTKK